MYLVLFFLLGVIAGTVTLKLFSRKDKIHGMINTKDKIYGTIDIEESSGLCRFRISDDQGLTDPKTKQAIFVVNHNARISRDEQPL